MCDGAVVGVYMVNTITTELQIVCKKMQQQRIKVAAGDFCMFLLFFQSLRQTAVGAEFG